MNRNSTEARSKAATAELFEVLFRAEHEAQARTRQQEEREAREVARRVLAQQVDEADEKPSVWQIRSFYINYAYGIAVLLLAPALLLAAALISDAGDRVAVRLFALLAVAYGCWELDWAKRMRRGFAFPSSSLTLRSH